MEPSAPPEDPIAAAAASATRSASPHESPRSAEEEADEAPPPGSPGPTSSEYLAACGTLGLAGVGTYLTATYAQRFHGGSWITWAVAGSALVGLTLGAWAGRRGRTRGWAGIGAHLVGAVALGLGPFVASRSLEGMLALVFVIGLASGPEVARIVVAHRERRAAGQPGLYPEGLPKGRLVAALAGSFLVLAATRHVTPERAGFLAGLFANLWALASVPLSASAGWGARLAMTASVAPALALAAAVGGTGPWILGAAAVPALALRVRLRGTAPAAAALLFGVMLLRPELAASKEATAGGFVVLKAARVRLTADAWDEALAGQHRETGGLRVQAAGMTFFTDRDDERRTEVMVHPALSLAPRRSRVLVLGGDCTGLTRELARYPALAAVDVLRLNPGVERFCRSVPVIAAHLGDPPPSFRVFDFDRPDVWAKALERQRLPYDAVLLFPPHPTFLPAELLKSLVRFVAPAGLMMVHLGNRASRLEAACVLSHLRGLLPQVVPLAMYPAREVTEEPAFFALASRRPLKLSSVRFRVETRAITADLFRASTHWPLSPRWLDGGAKACGVGPGEAR